MQQTEKLQYSKNLDGWNNFKKKLDNRGDTPMFKERDIWWASIGHNIGIEENGKGDEFKRPVLVVKKFHKLMFWGIPTSSVQKNGKYYHTVNYLDNKGRPTRSCLILSQMRVFDARRLMQKYGMIGQEELELVREKVCWLLGKN